MKQYKNTNYFITEDGKVFNLKNQQLKTTFNNRGYECVSISIDGKKYTKKVHRLVLETFNPTENNNLQCNHINGIKTDNRIENLEWVTCSQNMKHAFDNGFKDSMKGEANGMSKLTEDEVKQIIAMFSTNQFKQCEIAEIFDISNSQISRIVNKKKWNHI